MENKITIPIGQELARDIANGIKYEVSHNNALKHIELKARGKNIAKAVDVLEILKRELRIKENSIETHTDNLTSREGKEVKVSVINITLTKK